MTAPHSEEGVRKAIHLCSIAFPVATVLANRLYPEYGSVYLAAVLAAVAVLLMLFDLMKARVRPFRSFVRHFFGRVLRERELEGGMTGSTIVVASAAFTILVFREPVAVAALVFLSLGDSSAALVGKHFGRIRLVSGRTLEGSLAALNVCLASGMVMLWLAPDMGWRLTPATILVGSLVATVSELVDMPLDDNFRIPVFAGIAMELMLPG